MGVYVSAATSKQIKSLSFEEALQELEAIVRKLESGDATLEQSIEDYTRGSDLRKHCEKKLKDAQLKVEKILSAEQGATEPLDAA
jgi:exodeoxyribonuclease VII small subunit